MWFASRRRRCTRWLIAWPDRWRNLRQAVELIFCCAGRVVVTGMGKSGIIARKIAATLNSTGTPALFLHPVEAVHGDLGMIVRGDVVLALSASGETEEILQPACHYQAAAGAIHRHDG